jgi:DNA processing protein
MPTRSLSTAASVAVLSPSVPDDVLAARAYLTAVADAPAPALARLVAEVGPVKAAWQVARGVAPGVVAEETTRSRLHRAPVDLAAAAAVGIRLLTPEHDEWPHSPFADLVAAAQTRPEFTPPLGLWVRGPLPVADLTRRAVAVLGPRAATSYGMHLGGEFATELVRRDAVVVASGALGVEGAAHRGALAGRGPTIAVLPCGIDRSHPPAHAALLESIAMSGVVVSEYPPGSVPTKRRFIAATRLRVALVDAVVVVEAGLRSSALRVAEQADALRREVFAVPGPVTSAQSAGCHLLLQRGARLATGGEQVLDDLARLHPSAARPADRPVDEGAGR